MGDEIGEGGRVFSRPGMYGNAWDGDIASQHPSSAIAEVLFGVLYTKRFEEIKEARVAIKHHDYAKARTMLDGALVEYIDQLENGTAWFTAEDLAQALKIVINSVYGLTAANFENPFRDPRNKDNIVAKRGALFMTLLKSEVEKRGFCVAHIKTDSIKIPDATPEIMDFVIRFGKEYGYLFETEANFEKFCLVNDAVYVAKFKDGKHAGEWTATGTQFQVPYVFKKLFSKEPIEFKDMCETKSVASALYLDMNENLPDVSEQEKDLERIVKKAREFGVDMDTSGHSGDSELDSMVGEISKGHNYIFIGKVGQFCPIKPGCGGGLLMRETENKKTGEKGYAAAASSKGYRWLESEMVRELGKEESIDLSYVDITAPLYWWKEFDTYKVGTVANSCSTMHKIAAKRFERDDFSHEHLMDGGNYILNSTIDMLNEYRAQYLDSKDKKYWCQIIQLLPSSYNQKRTVMLNYEVLANIYKSRQNHRLDEWCEHEEMVYKNYMDDVERESIEGQFSFCDWIESLPYSELITGPDLKATYSMKGVNNMSIEMDLKKVDEVEKVKMDTYAVTPRSDIYGSDA